MSAKRLGLAVAAIGVLAAIVWERNAIAVLRDRNDLLRQLREEAAQLELQRSELQTLRAKLGDQPAPEASGSELLRLRNEVRQLRDGRLEWDRLKVENNRLAAEIQSGALPQQFSETAGYLAKEAWSNAGFDSPESALQTFFWAVREGDLERVAACFPENDRQYLTSLSQPGKEQERERTLAEFRQMIQSSGLRIVEKVVEEEGFLTKDGQPVSGEARIPTKVQLRIQAVAGGWMWPVSLRLYPDGWKVKGF